MNGLNTRSKNIKTSLLAFMVSLNLNGVGAIAQASNQPSDELIKACEECDERLTQCLVDLSETRAYRGQPEWYQNDLVIVGIGIFAFGSGWIIGGATR
jgi:hypothetical protein